MFIINLMWVLERCCGSERCKMRIFQVFARIGIRFSALSRNCRSVLVIWHYVAGYIRLYSVVYYIVCWTVFVCRRNVKDREDARNGSGNSSWLNGVVKWHCNVSDIVSAWLKELSRTKPYAWNVSGSAWGTCCCFVCFCSCRRWEMNLDCGISEIGWDIKRFQAVLVCRKGRGGALASWQSNSGINTCEEY